MIRGKSCVNKLHMTWDAFKKEKKKGIEKKAQQKNTHNNVVWLMIDEIRSDTKVLLYEKDTIPLTQYWNKILMCPRKMPWLVYAIWVIVYLIYQ